MPDVRAGRRSQGFGEAPQAGFKHSSSSPSLGIQGSETLGGGLGAEPPNATSTLDIPPTPDPSPPGGGEPVAAAANDGVKRRGSDTGSAHSTLPALRQQRPRPGRGSGVTPPNPGQSPSRYLDALLAKPAERSAPKMVKEAKLPGALDRAAAFDAQGRGGELRCGARRSYARSNLRAKATPMICLIHYPEPERHFCGNGVAAAPSSRDAGGGRPDS
jgi:hypothetical protein